MEHALNPLEDVTITEKKSKTTTQNKVFINEKIIKDNIHQNISNILESASGVSILKTGYTISKPIVHGLYGNRLAIINNGIPQNGQQWGNDHSPEIDPLAANKLTVIKGANALEYAGVNFGSVIVVESGRIEKDPHFHGNGSYFFETNGLSNGINVNLQQYTEKLGWKMNGTFKISGDKKTPNYYLTNTASVEKHFSLQLEKDLSNRLVSVFHFSSYNSKLGILKGAHISNLTDLEEALKRDIPFFTKDKHSYDISAPYQNVNHHLAKLKTTYYINDNQYLNFTLAGQLNIRKEYDVRRLSTNKKPAMSLKQYSLYGEGKYVNFFSNNLKLNIGLQYNYIDNTNDYETGILPLIPDYISINSGIYSILTKNVKNLFFEFGLRYDNIYQDVAAISNTSPRKILRYDNLFHNYSSSLGVISKINDYINLYFNLGYATRNPAINELYSNGLHQGVSGIEEGNPDLNSEKSIKSTLAFNANFNNKLTFESLFYYHQIADYIYLKPENEFRLTIRGAYPVFTYNQTDATIFGLDVSSEISFSKALNTRIIYSYIKGKDTKNNVPLINIPSSNLSCNIQYIKPIKFNKSVGNFEFVIENKYVFKQNNLNADQDYIAPPDGYYLLGIHTSLDFPFANNSWRLFLKANNLLNTSYRDYLNRQKYFADEVGRNIILGVNLQF